MKPLRSFASMWGFQQKKSELLAMVSDLPVPSASLCPALSRPVTYKVTGPVLVFMKEAPEGDGTSQEVTTEECSSARSENKNHPKLRGPRSLESATASIVR